MKALVFLMHAGAAALLVAAAGCDRNRTESAGGVLQTRFPGQVTAGGGTSGQTLARNSPRTTDATYAGGTPGIAGGSGGTTGGAATAGTVQESGQGPSQGTTQPSSVGRPGAHLPAGDKDQPSSSPAHAGAGGATPDQARPAPATTGAGGAAAHHDNPAPAAPGR